jgi:hypothetical protein
MADTALRPVALQIRDGDYYTALRDACRKRLSFFTFELLRNWYNMFAGALFFTGCTVGHHRQFFLNHNI